MTRHAAIDVGSNSVRLLIADVDRPGWATPVHQDREVVRLGTGVFQSGRLSSSSMDDALEALERMSIAIGAHGVSSVRAVGTSALRDATNQSRFVRHATAVLGTPLEVIDGLEEARLVHAGVRARRFGADERIVIVDLGGGSAQLVLSDRGDFADAVSLPLGAVRLTEAFTGDGPLEAAELLRMRRHVREILFGVLDRWLLDGVDRLVATSGSARTVVSVVHGLDRSERSEADGSSATASDVAMLLQAVVGTTSEERGNIPGVGRRRAQVLPAGIAVLHEIVESLGVSALHYSSAGLADGIIDELARSAATESREPVGAVGPVSPGGPIGSGPEGAPSSGSYRSGDWSSRLSDA